MISSLKLFFIVIDGMADLPIEELGDKTPLEAAITPNMDFLANTGVTGLMYSVEEGVAPESDAAVVSILGYDPFKYDVRRGVLEALGANLSMKEGDLALRCNFATLSPGNKIVDRRVGRNLTFEEATELAETINEKVKLESHSASFQFKNTKGHRGALIIKSREKLLSGNISNTDPAYDRVKGVNVAKSKVEMLLKKCMPLERTEEAKISAELINEFTRKSMAILDKHEINKKRVTEGNLKANVILMRGAGHHLPKFPQLKQQYGLSFACLTRMPVEKGISKLAGMQVINLPPSSNSLLMDCKIRLTKLLEEEPYYDCFYIHIKGPDEPGHDGDFNQKKELITVIDNYFVGRLLQKISLQDNIVCITSDHSTPCKLKVHSEDPVPLLIAGDKIQNDEVKKFSERDCKKGRLGILSKGTELMPKLIKMIKNERVD